MIIKEDFSKLCKEGACLVAGRKISINKGHKNIEDIKVGYMDK